MSKSPSLRRIQADIRELALDPSDRYHAAPLETDMFEWHFTIRGADGTDFEGGVYHGRIMLPPEYPFKPPHIIFLTPSGRFETNTKVCLSFSAYHPELWQPAWGIRLILEALISFLPTPADGAIGALDWTSAERKRLAKKSLDYYCPVCGVKPVELLPKLKPKCETDCGTNNKPNPFQKEIEKLRQLQQAQHAVQEEDKDKSKKDSQEEDKKKGGGETTKAEEEPTLKGEDKVSSSSGEATQPKVEEPVIKAAAAGGEQPAPASSQPETASTKEPSPLIAPAPIKAPAPVVVQPPQSPNPSPAQSQQNIMPAETPQTVQPPVQEEVHVAAPQPVQPRIAVPEDDGMMSWMVDPVLHGIIVVLAVLCFLMLRKLQAMMEELDALNQVLES